VTDGAPVGRNNLAVRAAAALVMAPLALAVTWWGGWPFVVFWMAAGIVVFIEWTALTVHSSAGGAAWVGRRWLWILAGLVYAVLLVLATVVLRLDSTAGLVGILFLFAVVWMTDVAAYFAGRALQGPKLWPKVSPNKTWSGAIGGAVAGTAGGVAVAAAGGFGAIAAVVAVAFILSLVSQAGDLAESALKRRFGVKDASLLIPGHGGLLDRLDGFAAAVVVAALLGIWRGGLEAPALGLLEW